MREYWSPFDIEGFEMENNLVLKKNVKVTPTTARVIALLDPYFKDEQSYVTSATRTPEDQLRIIVEKVKRHGIDKLFPEFTMSEGNDYSFKIKLDEQEFFWWARAWSKLLSINDIVNPPCPAEVLFDYFRPGSTTNRKGRIIDISNHMRGNSFDIGGAENLSKKAEIVKLAVKNGDCFIQNYLEEKVNNSIHIDAIPIL